MSILPVAASRAPAGRKIPCAAPARAASARDLSRQRDEPGPEQTSGGTGFHVDLSRELELSIVAHPEQRQAGRNRAHAVSVAHRERRLISDGEEASARI